MKRTPLRLTLFIISMVAGVLAFVSAAAAENGHISPLTANPNIGIRPIVDAKYYQLIVDKETEIVTALRRDEGGKYTIIDRQMVCSTGRTPARTPLGTFKISTKRRWLYSPASASHPTSYEQFACRFNNKIWFHSTVFDKANTNTLQSDSYLGLGQPISAGCVRLSVRDSLWIYANCPTGTVVKVVTKGGPTPVYVEPLPPLPAGSASDPTDPTIAR